MTSEQALEVAKINRAAHQAADIANLFKGYRPKPKSAPAKKRKRRKAKLAREKKS